MITDITNRKLAKAALRESEWKYRMVADFTYDWEFWIAPDGNYVYVSPACERITGYAPHEFQASPQLMTEIIHPDDKKVWVKHLTISKKIALANLIEFRIIARDGTQRWIGHVCQPVYHPDGNYLGHRGSNRDITEQKQVEIRLIESEKKFRTLTDLAPVGVYMTDPDGHYKYVNQRWLDMTGMTFEDALGDGWINGVYPDDRQRVSAEWQKISESYGQRESEYRFQTPAGKITWVLGLTTELFNRLNEKIGYIGVNTDITERKNIEETLRQNVKRYRDFVENMSEGFVVFNKNMEFAYVNEQFCKITGYGKEDLIGKTCFNHFDEDNQKIVKEQCMKIRKGEGKPYQIQSVCKDGNRIFLNISPKPIFDSDGVFHGSFSVVSNITQHIKEYQEHVETTMTQIDNLNRENQEYNHALKALLKNSQEWQKTIEENILSNVREIIAPFLEKLKKTRLSDNQKNLIDAVENNLNNIISPFVRRLKAEMRDLTPMEIQVANLIREGKTTKDVADILTISENTVMFHRTNIRKKLGLQHQNSNLMSYLLSLN